MTQRQERHATRAEDDLEPEAAESAASRARLVDEDLPEFDLEVAPFEPQPTQPADPVAVPAALRGEDPLREFSDNARKRYDLEVSAFAADLRRQSLVHKRSQGGDNVSGRNVASAAFFLRSYRANGFLKHLGAVGGLLIGLGAQSLGSMIEKGVYTTGGVLWSVSTTVTGVALFMWHAAQDRS